MSIVLDVNVRENTGTGGSRAARRDGFVPGVIYGGDEAPVAVSVKYNEVLKAINSGQFLSNMIEISHDGKSQKVLTKDVQFHPVTDMPVHVDFYRVTAKSIIEVEVSVNFVGEDDAPALKQAEHSMLCVMLSKLNVQLEAFQTVLRLMCQPWKLGKPSIFQK